MRIHIVNGFNGARFQALTVQFALLEEGFLLPVAAGLTHALLSGALLVLAFLPALSQVGGGLGGGEEGAVLPLLLRTFP